MSATHAKTSSETIPSADQASNAEYAVLGSMLIGEPEVLSYTINHVDEDHFLDAKNKMLFKVFKRMYQAGVGIDITTVEGHLTAHEKKMFGLTHFIDLTEKVTSTLNVRHYHAIMRNRAITVQLGKQYDKIQADPFNEETRKDIAQLWDKLNNHGAGLISLKDATIKYTDTIDRRRAGREFRLLSGYPNLDDKIGGFFGGNLVAVGARTSLGKTSLLLNIALNFLKKGHRVLFVSAEMITDEILDRMVAMDADLPISRLRKGQVHADDLRNMNTSLAKFHDMPMTFLEGGKMGLGRLRTAVEATNPSVIFVDFIQRFVPPNPAMNRAAYFSDLANELKAMAIERKIVVFAASQLNRDLEKDTAKGRPPNLSDFKESGGIEEACDIAILLQANKKEETTVFKKIILHICKNRSGPTGHVNFMFQKARTMFFEEEPPLPEEELNLNTEKPV